MSQVLSPAASPENGDESVPKRLNRSYVACKKCHDHKIKCSGETPKCRNCQQAKKPGECVYPVRDRKLSVPESYLKRLEAENRELKRKRSSERVPYISPSATSTDSHDAGMAALSGGTGGTANSELNVEEDFSFENDETFIEPNYIGEAACTTFGSRLHQYLTGDDSQSLRRPHYFRDRRLHRLTSPEYQLPNRNYAQRLVMRVLTFIGPDYHLLLKKSFLEKLDETYRLDRCYDYVWLCRLFVVFALGELYSQRASSGSVVPGTAYFMKAMALFEDLYEEPSIEYIETLLIISFYATALNRRNTAYAYSGLALRLSLTLGLHRKIPDDRIMTSREREHRIRVWWTVYNLDRVCSSKVGLPIMLRDEDIDVPLPSMETLTDDEREDFHDPSYIIAQYKLAKITGDILNDIYRIPQPGRAKTFPHDAHKILKSLRSWQETLPPILKFNPRTVPMYSSRSVASLHLNYSQCVMLATRPIFFPCLRSHHEASKNGSSNGPRPISPLVDGLSEACVHAARTSSSIIAQLEINGDLATFGFFDALSIFSSTLILMMSCAMQYKAHGGDHDAVETSLSLLEAMRNDGNMPAHNYYEQLMLLKCDLDRATAQINEDTSRIQIQDDQNKGLQLLLAASTPYSDEIRTTARPLGEGPNFGAFMNSDTGVLLDDPFIQDFLNQQQPYAQYMTDALPAFPDDLSAQWEFDFLDLNIPGTF